ncbi:MAG: hypothetical protein HQK89_11470 [Nitrospirae bacterium]|nr:hypothetical protein [Nitrospirota bacterium]
MKKAVAFGDSLTVGFQSPTMSVPYYQETPYTHFLSQMAAGKLEFASRGINGELTSDMLNRFDDDVLALYPDYVIILGGTNDIGWGVATSEIFENLSYMYNRAKSHGITPVAVTVPSLRGYDSFIPPRLALNEKIISFANVSGFPFADLFAHSSEPETLRLRAEYSNDGLHLTTAGYKLIADLLYEKIFAAL